MWQNALQEYSRSLSYKQHEIVLFCFYIRYTVSCLFLYLILPIFSIVEYLPFRYNSAHRRSGGMSWKPLCYTTLIAWNAICIRLTSEKRPYGQPGQMPIIVTVKSCCWFKASFMSIDTCKINKSSKGRCLSYRLRISLIFYFYEHRIIQHSGYNRISMHVCICRYYTH